MAEPMLYRRAADPKPPPHREPRRGGSVFHGAKSAPWPDVVMPAVHVATRRAAIVLRFAFLPEPRYGFGIRSVALIIALPLAT